MFEMLFYVAVGIFNELVQLVVDHPVGSLGIVVLLLVRPVSEKLRQVFVNR